MKRYCELSIPRLDPMTATLSRYGVPQQQHPLAGYLPIMPQHTNLASYYMYIQTLLLEQQASKYVPFLRTHAFQLHQPSLLGGLTQIFKSASMPMAAQPMLLTPPLSDSGSTEKSSHLGESPSLSHSDFLKRKQSTTNIPNNGPTSTGSPRKKSKTVRKISFETNSPISGILIKPVKSTERDIPNNKDPANIQKGDIDAKYNVIDISDESRGKLKQIENAIGDYICRLCKQKFEDVYQLAQHRCPSIVYIEYRCPECSKVFNCPANLASHRRWHKPKTSNAKSTSQGNKQKREDNSKQHGTTESLTNTSELSPDLSLATAIDSSNDSQSSNDAMKCKYCNQSFQKLSCLGKHMSAMHSEKKDA